MENCNSELNPVKSSGINADNSFFESPNEMSFSEVCHSAQPVPMPLVQDDSRSYFDIGKEAAPPCAKAKILGHIASYSHTIVDC